MAREPDRPDRGTTRRRFTSSALLTAGGAIGTVLLGRFVSAREDPTGGATRDIGLWSAFGRLHIPDYVSRVRTSGFAQAGLGAATYRLDPDQNNGRSSAMRRRSANGRWFRIEGNRISYAMAGAVGVPETPLEACGNTPKAIPDDTEAIQHLYDYLGSIGGGTAMVDRRRFHVSSIGIAHGGITTEGLGPESHVRSIARAGRPAVFDVTGPDRGTRLADLSWRNLRISGGACWGGRPDVFNGVLCGYGIRTRSADRISVSDCLIEHMSDSGVSVRDGNDALIARNTIRNVAQGIDIFYHSTGGRVIENQLSAVSVFAGINIEGRKGIGHPRETIVRGNRIDGATTCGIDIIEAGGTRVEANRVRNVAGNHPQYPGYAFGIQLFGSPTARVESNDVAAIADGANRVGVGIEVGANSSRSIVAQNLVRDASLAPIRVSDTNGTAVTLKVLLRDNRIDGPVLASGNVSLDDVSDIEALQVRRF